MCVLTQGLGVNVAVNVGTATHTVAAHADVGDVAAERGAPGRGENVKQSAIHEDGGPRPPKGVDVGGVEPECGTALEENGRRGADIGCALAVDDEVGERDIGHPDKVEERAHRCLDDVSDVGRCH